ncbi:hypothetical protein DUI87_33378 [Hirundo rustica rustica]|uniref:Uncharacterized protein n=1 Tax=Hirundo rustica rustica TaxID=333673 RepID=A0A3M0IP87_HIRRU|nr:hypothetical protein DUI87_33378 [Hirundo rustica rustica]
MARAAEPPPALSDLQERSRCLESARQGIPYVLAWLLPALTLLAQLLSRGGSATDIAPVVPWHGGGSNATFGLYCSSCLLLIHPRHDICSQSGGDKNAGLEEKIIFLLYVLLVLGCCSALSVSLQGPEPLSPCPQILSVSLQGPEPLSRVPQALSVSLQGSEPLSPCPPGPERVPAGL